MEDFYEHIDDYMNGLLSSEALAQFEVELGRNDSLRIAVDNYDAAKAISEGLLEVDVLSVISELDREHPNQHIARTLLGDEETKHNNNQIEKQSNHITENDRLPKESDRSEDNSAIKGYKSIKLRKLLAVASFVGVVVMAGWWITKSQTEADHKAYVLANIETPIDEDATKSVDTIGMTNLQKGKYLYRLNQFDRSIVVLQRLVRQEKDQNLLSKGYFWLGHAYIQVWKVDEAKEAWNKSNEEGVEKAMQIIK